MSNVYSYGMVLWEMITGEEAYSTYSPVQAAVGIAACGLRPEIPRDCPPFLRSLMNRCWDNNPLKRPQFSEIISILQRQNARQFSSLPFPSTICYISVWLGCLPNHAGNCIRENIIYYICAKACYIIARISCPLKYQPILNQSTESDLKVKGREGFNCRIQGG